MRVAFLLLLCACRREERIEPEHAHEAAAPIVVETEAAAPSATVVVAASASASASIVAPPARIPCGAKTCAAFQFCVHTTKTQGITPPAGRDPVVSSAFECWNSLPGHGGGYACGTPDMNRQVSCQAMIPSMAPR